MTEGLIDCWNDLISPELYLTQHRSLIEVSQLGLNRNLVRLQNFDFLQEAVNDLIYATDRQVLPHSLERQIELRRRCLQHIAIVALLTTLMKRFG